MDVVRAPPAPRGAAGTSPNGRRPFCGPRAPNLENGIRGHLVRTRAGRDAARERVRQLVIMLADQLVMLI